jgi:hypothetical protein
VFENRVWRRIFGPKREEIAGDWRQSDNADLFTKYYYVIHARRLSWMGNTSLMGQMQYAYIILGMKN